MTSYPAPKAPTEPTEPTHYLVITYPSWAHNRSEIGLSMNLLLLNPSLRLTVLIAAKRWRAAALELAQYPTIEDESRLVLLHYGKDEQEVGGMWNPRGGFMAECIEQLEPVSEGIVRREAIEDPVTGQKVTPHPIPYSVVITDVTLGGFARGLKTKLADLYPDRAPPSVLGFGPYNTAFFAFLWLEEYQYFPRIVKIMEESGDDLEKRAELADQMIGANEDLVQIDGLWPFYFREASPVEKESNVTRLTMLYRLNGAVQSWFDGIIMGWPSVLGHDLQASLERKFRLFYQVGPQLPPVVQDEWTVESQQGECKAYLDASEPKSVLYMSFGSVLYAPTEEQIGILLDVLDELDMRYIMAEGNAPSEIKDMMRARIGTGKSQGLLVAWAPQRAILSHPSTAMFMTHGGSNSAMESILFQVPMIQWPAGFDQPAVANELDRLGVARELIQIRGGSNIGRRLARDGRVVEGTPEAVRKEMRSVLDGMRGGGTDAMRAKLREVAGAVQADRESGASHEAMLRLSQLGGQRG